MEKTRRRQRPVRRSMRRGNKCINCVHAMFNETWGEYDKCSLHKSRIADADDYTDCKDFKKKAN